MNPKASRIVLLLGAFLGGLVLFLGAIFLVTGFRLLRAEVLPALAVRFISSIRMASRFPTRT